MPKADCWRLGAAALICLSVTACSETTWRRSTMHHVQLDHREISVSWIRLQPEEIEIVAWEPSEFDGPQSPDFVRLDRITAARAAEIVVKQLCWHDYVAAPVPGTYAEGHHAFRYTCLAANR